MNEKLKIDFFEISRIDHPDKFTGKAAGRTGGFGTWSDAPPTADPITLTDDDTANPTQPPSAPTYNSSLC